MLRHSRRPAIHTRQHSTEKPTLAYKFTIVMMITTLICASIYAVHNRWVKNKTRNNDLILVIGGGSAGLSAALQSASFGARVLLVDKHKCGGNSAKATSGTNAVNSKYQAHSDSAVESFVADIISSGRSTNNRTLATIFAARSGKAINHLTEALNLSLSDINRLAGHREARTHRVPPQDDDPNPFGYIIMQRLREVVQQMVTIKEFVRVIDMQIVESVYDGRNLAYVDTVTLQHENGQTEIVDVRAIIIASGGICGDTTEDSVLAQLRPDLIGFPTTNAFTSSGDIQQLALRLGFDMVGVNEIQLHPTAFVHPSRLRERKKILCPEVIRGLGAILVNFMGEQFLNELENRDVISKAIIAEGGKEVDWGFTVLNEPNGVRAQSLALLVFDSLVAKNFGAAAIKFYTDIGVLKFVTSDDCLRQIAPVVSYNTICKVWSSARPNRTFEGLFTALVTPALHYTLGGIKFDLTGRVSIQSRLVYNMYVAGEAAGGLHGHNRLGGNGIGEALVFGQMVGKFASMTQSYITSFPVASNQVAQTEVLYRSDDILILSMPLFSSVAKSETLIDQLYIEVPPPSPQVIVVEKPEIISWDIGTVTLRTSTNLQMIYPGHRAVYHMTN